MGFYLDLDVDEMTEDLWADHPATGGNTPALGNSPGKHCQDQAENEQSPTTVTDCQA